MDALEELRLARWIRAKWLRDEDLVPFGLRLHIEVLLARLLIVDTAQECSPFIVDGVLHEDPATAFMAIQEFDGDAPSQQRVVAEELAARAAELGLLKETSDGFQVCLSRQTREVAEKVRRYLEGATIQIGEQSYNINRGQSLAHDGGDEF